MISSKKKPLRKNWNQDERTRVIKPVFYCTNWLDYAFVFTPIAVISTYADYHSFHPIIHVFPRSPPPLQLFPYPHPTGHKGMNCTHQEVVKVVLLSNPVDFALSKQDSYSIIHCAKNTTHTERSPKVVQQMQSTLESADCSISFVIKYTLVIRTC